MSKMPTSEYHVASFLAHAIMAHIDVVKAAISTIDGSEIHGVSPTGKIIFTLNESRF